MLACVRVCCDAGDGHRADSADSVTSKKLRGRWREASAGGSTETGKSVLMQECMQLGFLCCCLLPVAACMHGSGHDTKLEQGGLCLALLLLVCLYASAVASVPLRSGRA